MDVVECRTKTSLKQWLEKNVKSASSIDNKQSRTEIVKHIAKVTGLKRIEVESVFHSLASLVCAHMQEGGSGTIQIPFCGIKLQRVYKKAQAPRLMQSPLTGTWVEIPAKPARVDIKVTAQKQLRDLVLVD